MLHAIAFLSLILMGSPELAAEPCLHTAQTVATRQYFLIVLRFSPEAGPVVLKFETCCNFGSYIDEPLMMVTGGQKYYYHDNDMYSTYALTDASGAVVERYKYDPYGKVTILAADGTTVRAVSAVGNPLTYTGRRLDGETGLYYYRARYYDVTLGRFISRDPIGINGGIDLYAYVSDAPTSRGDPSGCGGMSFGFTKTEGLDANDKTPGYEFYVVMKGLPPNSPLVQVCWTETSAIFCDGTSVNSISVVNDFFRSDATGEADHDDRQALQLLNNNACFCYLSQHVKIEVYLASEPTEINADTIALSVFYNTEGTVYVGGEPAPGVKPSGSAFGKKLLGKYDYSYTYVNTTGECADTCNKKPLGKKTETLIRGGKIQGDPYPEFSFTPNFEKPVHPAKN